MEHLGTVNLRWQLQPETVGILGYQYGETHYTADERLFVQAPPPGADIAESEDRNTRSHYFYVGVDQSFTPQLNGSLRVGAQFTDYYNANDDTINPYADGNLTWTYNPDSWVQLGVRHTRAATDISLIGNEPNKDQELTTVYGSLNHRISGKLVGSILAQYQHAIFEDAPSDETENFFLAGVNLSYQINEFLSAETGYNFDRLDSDISNRSYTRNRVYIGIRATY
jgi:uncharacterized protein (PEP-CTERM system associated)